MLIYFIHMDHLVFMSWTVGIANERYRSEALGLKCCTQLSYVFNLYVITLMADLSLDECR